MTQEQAVKLWYAATYEEYTGSVSGQVITKPSLFNNLLFFQDYRKIINKNWTEVGVDGYSKSDCKEVAEFLRQWADALEGK